MKGKFKSNFNLVFFSEIPLHESVADDKEFDTIFFQRKLLLKLIVTSVGSGYKFISRAQVELTY
jgi:hypothetical protein